MYVVLADAAPLTWHNLFATVEGWVALGTLALALVTVFLAASTRAAVKKAGQEIEVTRETAQDLKRQTAAIERQAGIADNTLASTFRPVLMNVPQDYGGFRAGEIIRYPNGPPVELSRENRWLVNVLGSEKHFHVSVPVRNTGEGVAFIRATSLSYEGENAVSGTASNAVVPPGETARIAFSFSTSPMESSTLFDRINQYGSFSVEIVYTDLGGHYWRSRLDVNKRVYSEGWYVRQAFVWADGTSPDEAVGSGPMTEPA